MATSISIFSFAVTTRYFGAAKDLPGVRELFQQEGTDVVLSNFSATCATKDARRSLSTC